MGLFAKKPKNESKENILKIHQENKNTNNRKIIKITKNYKNNNFESITENEKEYEKSNEKKEVINLIEDTIMTNEPKVVKDFDFSDDKVTYKEKFFDYKNFPNNNLKRINEPKENNTNISYKKSKKNDWISKENSEKRDDKKLDFIYVEKKLEETLKKKDIFSDPENDFDNQININTEENTKVKPPSKYSELMSLKKNMNIKIGPAAAINNIELEEKKKVDELDLQTLDDTFDNFYEVKPTKPKNPFIPPNKNLSASIINRKVNFNTNVIINNNGFRTKKEREKMNGYKCEICENVNKYIFILVLQYFR